MVDNRKILLGSAMAIILLIGVLAASPNAQAAQADGSEDQYKELLETIDGAIRSLRFGNDPTSSLESAKSQYINLVGGGDGEVVDLFNSLIAQGEEAKLEDIQNLRGEVKEAVEATGISLPFYFDHAIFVILGISIPLSLAVTLINRKVVDWKKVNAAKARMKEWQNEFSEAKSKGNKKKMQKLKRRQDAVMKEQKEVMGSTMKPMIFYIIPYILLWWGLNSLYGGWVVAWIPFEFPWPDLGLRLFEGSFVSLGFLGWYILSYFGFAQIWRKFLIPS